MKRPLIIGQAPSATSDPDQALSGASGERLAELAGLSHAGFLRLFECINLIEAYPGRKPKGDVFPVEAARESALSLIFSGRMIDRRVVMLGASVADAFGLYGEVPWLRWHRRATMSLALCPHPSRIVQWWNAPGNVADARRFWRALVLESDPVRSPR